MAITFSNLGTSANPDINNNADQNSYANSSWTPPTSGLILVFVRNRATTPGTPSISGNGLTWVPIVSVTNGVSKITLFGANASGSSAGATTISFAGATQIACQASFFHADGVDLTGGVASCFVQSNTNLGTNLSSLSITLSAADHADNRPISGFFHAAVEATTFRTNWTEMDDLQIGAGGGGLETQYRGDTFETTASASWASSVNAEGIAAELKALTGSGNIDLDIVTYTSTINDITILENEPTPLDLVTYSSVINDISLLENEPISLDLVTYTSTINNIVILENELVLLDLVVYSSVISDLTILESDLVYLDLVIFTSTINDISLLEDSEIGLDLVTYISVINDIELVETSYIPLDLIIYSSTFNDIIVTENEVISLDLVTYSSIVNDIIITAGDDIYLDLVLYNITINNIYIPEMYIIPAIRRYSIPEESRYIAIEAEERIFEIPFENRNILIH